MKHTHITEHYGMFGNKSIHPASQMFYVITTNIFSTNRLERKSYDDK